MKYPKPSLLIFYGSLATLGFSFTFTLFVHLFISEVDSTLFFIIPILGAVFVYIIFSFLLRKFVEHRLSLLYRSIQTKTEATSVSHEDESLDSMIQNAEKEVKDWQSRQDQEKLSAGIDELEKLNIEEELEAHEKECAIRYQMVNDKLETLDKRMWRLEAMIMFSTASMIGLAVMLITQ